MWGNNGVKGVGQWSEWHRMNGGKKGVKAPSGTGGGRLGDGSW